MPLSVFKTPRLALLFALAAVACAPGEDEPTVNLSPEETVAGTIALRVLDSGDRGPGDRSLVQYQLRAEGQDGSAGDDRARIPLIFDAAPGFATGDRVELLGRFDPEGLFYVSAIDSREPAPGRGDGPVARTTTAHRVALVVLNDAQVTELDVRSAIDGEAMSVKDLMEEASAGIDTVAIAAYRRFALDYTEADCRYDNTGRLAEDAIAALEADGLPRSEYDHVVIVVPDTCGPDWNGAWSDQGAVRGDGTLDFARVSMIQDSAFSTWGVVHALGHNLGLNHAMQLSCDGAVYQSTGEGCSVDEYGNENDVMGSGEAVYYGAPSQRYLGWLAPAQVVTATAGGTFNLHAADKTTCGIRALRIPIPGEPGAHFYLEYRRARSDSSYAGTGAPSDLVRGNAVSILRATAGDDAGFTARIDLGTPPYSGADVDVRYDLGSGVAVTLRSVGDESARLDIESPGTGFPTDDTGDGSFVEADGSFGRIGCQGQGVDECPGDPDKDSPGECGCGVPDGTCTPSIAMSKESYAVGEDIVVNYSNLPGNFYDWIGLFAPGTANDAYLTFRYTQGTRSGTMTFDGRSAGIYEARLFFNDSYRDEQTISFRVE